MNRKGTVDTLAAERKKGIAIQELQPKCFGAIREGEEIADGRRRRSNELAQATIA